MTDGQWLFTLFALLYFVECLRLPPGSAWLYSGAGWLRRPLQHLDFGTRKLLLLPALPPLSAHGLLEPWRLVPTAEGLELLDDPPQVVPWTELKLSVEEQVLHLTSERRVRFTSPVSASAWLKHVQRWQKLADEAREKDFLKLAARMLETKRFSASMADVAARTRTLRVLGALIFGMCFGVISVIYRWLGEGNEVLWAAAVMLVLLWVQAVVFWRVCGQLGSKTVAHRFWKTLAISFLPQHAMRAADHVCAAWEHDAHPLAAIGSLEEPVKLRLLRRFWKEARHGQAKSAALQQRALEAFLKIQGIPVDQMEEVPEKQPGSAAYCPKCQAQFREATMLCQDCGGLPLKPF